MCDCEGYEKQLFDEPTVRAMAAHDLLIETHDFIDIEISTTLQRMFEPSHHVQCFTSIDDIQKGKVLRLSRDRRHESRAPPASGAREPPCGDGMVCISRRSRPTGSSPPQRLYGNRGNCHRE